MSYTPESQYPVISIREWSEPNFTRPAFEKLQSQSVGFHSVSDGCGVSGDSCVFL
ncbi:MAG: hypothetical protein OXC79_10915 [Candidatus Poribacteria bacterium]|nr:hypothetical protein [Candidatus Poribacteria bacterium]